MCAILMRARPSRGSVFPKGPMYFSSKQNSVFCVCLFACFSCRMQRQPRRHRQATGAFSHPWTWTNCSYMMRPGVLKPPGVQLGGSVRVEEATPAFSWQLCFPQELTAWSQARSLLNAPDCNTAAWCLPSALCLCVCFLTTFLRSFFYSSNQYKLSS